MINILFASKINKNIDNAETIKDQIEPISNHPLINFEHFDTSAELYNSNKELIIKLESKLKNKNIFFFDPNFFKLNDIIFLKKKNKLIKFVSICHECFGHYELYASYLPYVDYMIVHELSKKYWVYKNSKIIFSIHTVLNSNSFFYADKVNKNLDFYFSGTISNDRRKTLLFLKKNLDCIFEIGGGRYEKNQTLEDNNLKLKSSKASLVFPYNKRRFIEEHIDDIKQYKSSYNGRSTYCLSYKTLIFSKRFREIETFLTVNKHYITYHSDKNLLDKIHYFSNHEDERNYIVDTAKRKFLEVTSEENFKQILEKILNGEKFYYPVIKSNLKFHNFIYLIPLEYGIIKKKIKNFITGTIYKALSLLYHSKYKEFIYLFFKKF